MSDGREPTAKTAHGSTPRAGGEANLASTVSNAKGVILATKTVTDDTFDTEVLKNDKTVVVDFWAEWCGPCRQVSPILEELASEHDATLDVAKLNIDENPETPRSYGVLQIPTMHVFKDGEVVKQIVGAKPKAMLLKDLEGYI